MKSYTLKVKLISRTIIGSAEGYGAVIDKDVIFDETGIPYIPARRIKGCIRESAIEVLDMLKQAGINDLLNTSEIEHEKFKYQIVNTLFGTAGMHSTSPISFNNLYINNYDSVKEWLQYLTEDKSSREFISRDAVIAYYTDIAQQTAIDTDTGTAQKHSLRSIRYLKSGLEFIGDVTIHSHIDYSDTLLALSCLNLRYIGSMRTRGFGKVECKLEGMDTKKVLKKLEGLCIN